MTQPKVFWTTPKKVLFTIALAVIVWALFGCAESKPDINTFSVNYLPISGDTDLPFLQRTFQEYNTIYFHDKLPTDTKINLELSGNNMADTSCDNDDGTACTIRFNPHYVSAPRTAQSTMVHEMCHIKVWSKLLDANRPPMEDKLRYDHGKIWRSCMLEVDMLGAFREINIDFYREK